jgi:hypothetical protein
VIALVVVDCAAAVGAVATILPPSLTVAAEAASAHTSPSPSISLKNLLLISPNQ